MLAIGGLLDVFVSISAIAQDDIFVTTQNYLFEFDLAGWGWLHLLLGLLMFGWGAFVLGTTTGAAGFAARTGSAWVRGMGLALASLSLLMNFSYLPYYPLWAVVTMGVDVSIIYACTRSRPAR
ncbi:hypothetical protein ACGFXB_45800 [Streptomyces canus]|uniref:DUF7144 family membrane protein n=1 Tax=Streptomyces canus TaxID=58343 RepID=UPI00371AB36F